MIACYQYIVFCFYIIVLSVKRNARAQRCGRFLFLWMIAVKKLYDCYQQMADEYLQEIIQIVGGLVLPDFYLLSNNHLKGRLGFSGCRLNLVMLFFCMYATASSTESVTKNKLVSSGLIVSSFFSKSICAINSL